MSSEDPNQPRSDSANARLDSLPVSGETLTVEDTEMKRSAENTIKKYFHQLTSGCGRQDCDNEFCRSSGQSQELSKDEAAAMALKLLFKRAKLCDSQELLEETGPQDTKKRPNKEECIFTERKVKDLIEGCKETTDFTPLIRMIGHVFSSPELLNKSFLITEIPSPDSPEAIIPVDIKAVEHFYELLFSLEEQSVENALMNAITSLGTHIEIDLKTKHNFDPDKSYLHQFIVLLLNPSLSSPEFLETALPNLLKSLNLLPVTLQVELVRYWAKYPKVKLKGLVDMLHQLVTVRILMMLNSFTGSPVNDDDKITSATKAMKLFYYSSIYGGSFERNVISEASYQDTERRKPENDHPSDVLLEALSIDIDSCSEPLVPISDFINELLNDKIEMDRDFTNYKHGEPKFSFLNYPFILNTLTKSLGLFYDNRVRMYSERRIQVLFSLMEGQAPSPYLRLRVRRDHVIEDALLKLELVAQEKPGDLKKQLFVEFEGEQGIDEGGVSKEFFQMVIEELFNPDYGMFIYNNDTNVCWFNPYTFESDGQYTLVGLIFGLAIYNGIILDVHLPMVLYKKLLGKKLSLEDLASSHPEEYRSLKELLDYEGDVQNDIMATFQVGKRDIFGNLHTHDLKEQGKDIEVTNENRKEFITLYGNYLLNDSIEKQFKAFKRGFDTVTEDSMLSQLFRAEELELLVCGSKEFDIDDLEESTEYDGGFSKDSATIKNFWSLLREMTTAEQRQFLQFTTGSDRVPVGGLAKLRLIIARNGPDSDRLPTAHTCFNVLLMPDYSTKEKLKDRLLKAITHAKGFGLL